MELGMQAVEEDLTKMCMEKKNYMETYCFISQSQNVKKKIRVARKTPLLIDNGLPQSCGYFLKKLGFQ